MIKYCLFAIIALSLMSCERQEKPKTLFSSEVADNANDQNSDDSDTPDDDDDDSDDSDNDDDTRAMNEFDQTITRQIRQAILADRSLSPDARNIEIITIEGTVTLRGPIKNSSENDAIMKKIKNIDGVKDINNQLETQN